MFRAVKLQMGILVGGVYKLFGLTGEKLVPRTHPSLEGFDLGVVLLELVEQKRHRLTVQIARPAGHWRVDVSMSVDPYETDLAFRLQRLCRPKHTTDRQTVIPAKNHWRVAFYDR